MLWTLFILVNLINKEIQIIKRQFSNCSAISWRKQVNVQWEDDEVRFILDQHAELDASSLKHQSASRHKISECVPLSSDGEQRPRYISIPSINNNTAMIINIKTQYYFVTCGCFNVLMYWCSLAGRFYYALSWQNAILLAMLYCC
jgi:hypothetical protein